METKLTKQLDGLHSILSSIHQLHSRLPSPDTPAAGPGPFTAALLNTHNLPVVDYIRDADEVEARLFWYPPSGSNAAGPQSGAAGMGAAGLKRSEEDDAPSLETRVPQERAFVPPTPLRGTEATKGGGNAPLPQDIKVLLEAAKKLLDNGPHAPRARKHVKSLLQRERDATRSAQRDEALIKEGYRTLQTAAKDGGASTTAPLLAGAGRDDKRSLGEDGEIPALRAELEQLELECQKEEMEITALHVEKEDREDERKKLRTASAQPKKVSGGAAASASTQRGTATAVRGARGGSTSASRGRTSGGSTGSASRGSTAAIRSRTSGASNTSPTATRLKSKTEAARPKAAPAAAAVLASKPESSDPAVAAADEQGADEDVTVRISNSDTGARVADVTQREDIPPQPPAAVPKEASDAVPEDSAPQSQSTASQNIAPETVETVRGPQQPVGGDGPFAAHPPATEALQILTKRIWDAFGAPLRYLAPEAGSAGLDFDTTLDLLDRLACPSTLPTTHDGDESTSSAATGMSGVSGTSTNATQTANAQDDVQAPTAISTIGAYILWHLLRAPANELNWKDFPVSAAKWWITDGRPRFERATSKGGAGAETNQPTSEEMEEVKKFVAKPVYELVGKKLLRVKRSTNPPLLVFQ